MEYVNEIPFAVVDSFDKLNDALRAKYGNLFNVQVIANGWTIAETNIGVVDVQPTTVTKEPTLGLFNCCCCGKSLWSPGAPPGWCGVSWCGTLACVTCQQDGTVARIEAEENDPVQRTGINA